MQYFTPSLRGVTMEVLTGVASSTGPEKGPGTHRLHMHQFVPRI